MNAKNAVVTVALLAGSLAHAQDGAAAPQTTEAWQKATSDLQAFQDAAPGRLVAFGHYSDRRFIDMMAPHHAMAVEMATLALKRAEHPELRAMAQDILESQSSEIAEMKAVKQEWFGSDRVPSRMNPTVMENMGMMAMADLERALNFDCAFIDSMIPHHAAAIPMASVVLLHSKLDPLRTLSRGIIDAQSMEIGRMSAWRSAWCSSSLGE